MFLRALHRYLRFQIQLRAFARWRDEELWQKAVRIARVSVFSAPDIYRAFAYHRSANRPDVTDDQFFAMANALQRLGSAPDASTVLYWLWRGRHVGP